MSAYAPASATLLVNSDPERVDIPRDIHRRAQEASGKNFRMERLAIHPEDIGLFNRPPQTIKEKDSRSEAFKREFGKQAPTVELDALPVDEVRRRVREAVEMLIE